jgi:hypothetical protein
MPNSDVAAVANVAQPPSAVTAARFPRISQACWDLLNYFRRHNWEAHALDLILVNPLNYRARISDLRHDFAIIIEPIPPHPPPGTASLYKIPPESRPRAEYLLDHMSLDGFSDTPVQGGLFT